MKKQIINIALICVLGFVAITSALSKESQPVPNRRDAAKALMQKGNFKEALDAYRAILEDQANTTSAAAQDLQQATTAMQRLGRMDELDAMREKFATQQAKSWQNLLALAQSYQGQDHHGFIIAGKFERGGHRGGGEWANAMERDYVRSMQLMEQAIPLVAADANSDGRSEFYFHLAQMIRQGSTYSGDTWHFQVLTDYKTLPDYEKGYYNDRNQRGGAPVDKDGNPIFYTVPKSWDAAQSDGERWRWALSQAAEMNPNNLNRVRMSLAQFWQQQFGEQTMVQHQFFGRGLGDNGVADDGDEWSDGSDDVKKSQKLKDGPYAVHTLGEDETLARLATGVKRFKLPDEFNYITIYRQIIEEPKSGQVTEVHVALAQVFENRRQYVKAAEQFELAIKSTNNQNQVQNLRSRIAQITKNWGRLEVTKMQPAGEKASVDFTFRNATSVKFKAYPIKMDLLLKDAKDYIKTKPNQIDWNKIQVDVGSIGYRLVQQSEKKYIGELSAEWSEKLEPPTDPVMKHWDRRTTFETKLEKAGAYLLVAEVDGGNTTRVIVGLADTTIIKKQLDGKVLYLCVDAVTGKAIPKANLEFFGYKQNHIPVKIGNRTETRVEISVLNFAEFTDADGQVILDPTKMPQDFQWIITARTDAGRFAHLGFTYVGYNNRYDNAYNETKVFTITDRPVYRPGQKVKFKFWVRHAQYDQPDTSSFAKQTFAVEIHNPKGEKVLEKSFTADDYGGFDGEFDLPTDATLGSYQVYIPNLSGGVFRVEEYKKPEYEVKVDAPTEPVLLGEKITATVNAKYYFGSPVTNAKLKYKVTRTKHDERWYPICPWDWFYGRGYCWLAYDYVWYPGWRSWGCFRPIQSWWGHNNAPPEVVLDGEAKIGEDGTYKIEIDTALAKEMHGDQDHKYSITAEVVDESRRTIVGTGEVIVARKPFEVTTWIDRGYVRTGDTVNSRIHARTLSDKPVQGRGELTLFQVSYDEKGKPTEKRVESWKIDTNAEGEARQQFVAAAPGQYRLSYRLTDAKNHAVEGAYIFTVVGTNFDGKDFRFNDIELVPELTEYKPGDKMKLQINCNKSDATVYLFVRPTNGVSLPPQVLRMQGKSRIVEIEVTQKDMPNFFVEALTVSDAKVHTDMREIVVPPEKRVLNIAITPSETRYKPGEKAKVKFKLTHHTGEAFVGSTVVAIYDKSVEYISGGSNVPEIKEFFWKWRRSHYPSTEHNLAAVFYQLLKNNEVSMGNLGAFGHLGQMFDVDRKAGGEIMKSMAFGARGGSRSDSAKDAAAPPAPMSALAEPGAAAPMLATKESGYINALSDAKNNENQSGNAGSNPLVSPTIRSNFADTALWVAAITTNKDGTAEVELKMPENLTNWKIRVWGMGHGTKVGQGESEVVTAKDIIVRLQAPRFFVEKDEVVLSANVHNYLKTEKEVTVSLDLDGNTLILPKESATPQTIKVKIPAGGEKRVDWRVSVKSEGEALVRMSAKTDEDSDAMEQKFPVYVHGMLKTESFSGMLRPADNAGKINFTVPLDRRPDQSRIEVRFSPTLAGACVDALPYLAEYPYGCTEQTLNRFVPTVVTQKILQRMKLDLKAIKDKRTNLNAQEIGDPMKRVEDWKRNRPSSWDHNPVFDNEEVTSMVKSGVQRLTEMQCSDGGWGWFSGYGEYSSPHTTAVVVHGLQLAKANDVALVPGMVERGVEWLKNYQAEQVRLLKVGDEIRAQREKDPNALIAHRDHKMKADHVDALVYMVLADADVKNNEMTEYLFRDRIDLAIYAKSMYGVALQKQGEKEKVATILENIKQFVVEDNENQTAYLKLPENNYWWCWYGSEIEAHAFYLKLLTANDPKGELAPKIVKYLLNNRKHASYWNSTRDTAYAIEALADYMKASGEDEPDMTVEILVDGQKKKEVKITAKDLFTMDNTLVLTGSAVTGGKHTIEVKKVGKGPLYYNAYVTNFTLEDMITRTGLEVKVNRKFYKLVKDDKSINVSGSRGQVVSQKVEKYDRVELANLAELKSGDLLEIELEIDSKNDYEYVLFEDMKAAGAEAVEVRSGYNGNSMGAYVEFRDNRVAFFIRSLARGKHSVSYRLRAEIPGQFSALPAKASGMYAPELVGNSDELKLRIVD